MEQYFRSEVNSRKKQNKRISMKPVFLSKNKWNLLIIVCLLLVLNGFKTAPKPLEKIQKPNILLICVDDLRPELKSFGSDYISSPNIDQLSQDGFSCYNHYVNAPSCGPSRYTLLTGQYGPADNYALFKRAKKINDKAKVDPSMPEWFKTNGYTTVSVGKVSHHPGGRAGADWNDSINIEMPNAWDRHLMPVGEWEHPRGAMHGLAFGEIRKNDPAMDVFQSAEGDDNIYPDGLIANEAVKQLRILSADKDKPFFLAVGIIKPHLPFGAPKSYYDLYNNIELPKIKHPNKPNGKTTWHSSGEFMKYNTWDKNPNKDPNFADDVRRHYAACVSYADAQVGKVMAELKRTGVDKNTIVVLWGDHGWHLGEHGVWGKHTLFEESLNSPLIIHYPKMKHRGENTNAIVTSVDIFPTLCDLSGVEIPEFTKGVSLKRMMEENNDSGHSAVAYYGKSKTIRTVKYRMTLHDDGFVELYDHTTPAKETNNIADANTKIIEQLKKELETILN